MDDDAGDALFDELAAAIGAPALSPEEVAAVLRLAKVVADASQRRFAPVSCYAAGLVIGAAGSGEPGEPAERLARLHAFIDLVSDRAPAEGQGTG